MKEIFTRKSVRLFLDKPVAKEDQYAILKAGMAGPSAVNSRDWAFLLVDDKEVLRKMAEANGPAANPLRTAAFAVLICGDLSRSFSAAPDYWVIDGSIAAQNMLLTATELGIGSVWLGTWPQEEKVHNQAALFSLPSHIRPHSILAFGYADPNEVSRNPVKPEWEEDRLHYNKW